MEVHLPEDLQRYLHDEVRAGRFPSEDQVVSTALRQFQKSQEAAAVPPALDPWLGSMREDADLLDDIVEDAMRIREERPWRLPPGESGACRYR